MVGRSKQKFILNEKWDFSLSDVIKLGCTTPSTPKAEKWGENANFVSLDTMDFKIQALLDGYLVIEKLAKKSHLMSFHPL